MIWTWRKHSRVRRMMEVRATACYFIGWPGTVLPIRWHVSRDTKEMLFCGKSNPGRRKASAKALRHGHLVHVEEQQRGPCIWSQAEAGQGRHLCVFRTCTVSCITGYYSHCTPTLTDMSFWTPWLICPAREGWALHKRTRARTATDSPGRAPPQRIRTRGLALLRSEQPPRLLIHLPAASGGLVPSFWPRWSLNQTQSPCLWSQSGLLVWSQGLQAHGAKDTARRLYRLYSNTLAKRLLLLQMFVRLVWVRHLTRLFPTL